MNELIEQFDDKLHDLIGEYLDKGGRLNKPLEDQVAYFQKMNQVLKFKANLLLKIGFAKS